MKHNFEKYCKDFTYIENYEKARADNFKGWHCHHRLETHNSDGERRLVYITAKELVALEMYYNRPSNELIFMTTSEHHSLHNKGKKGKKLSEEHKKKISEKSKGRKHTTKSKNKIANSMKGNTNTKGMYWFNNGKENKVCYECPSGFLPGRLKK